MGLRGKATSGGDFEQPPEGTHRAVCTRVVDMGTQPTSFGDKRRVQIGFEIDELREDGKPYMAFATYTLSFHSKSNLMHMLESWRGKAFEDDDDIGVDAVLGRPCLLTLVRNGDYTNISSISPMVKGMEKLVPVGDTVLFDCDEPDLGELEKLGERMRQKIEESPEYRKAMSGERQPVAQEAAENDPDDDIPW